MPALSHPTVVDTTIPFDGTMTTAGRGRCCPSCDGVGAQVVHSRSEAAPPTGRWCGHPGVMRSLLDGPPPALPGPLDRLLEAWAMARPRVRFALGLALTLGVVLVQGLHLAAVQARWGGDPVAVWQATRTVPAGVDPRAALERVRLPRAAIPTTAVTERIATGETLALPLAEGGILTSIHLSRAGPAAALAADERLVPIPVERSWGIEAGSVVDVWAVDGTVAAPEPLATGRRVLQLREDGPQPVALVSVDARDVATTTVSLARGRVLLTHVGG